MYPSNDYGGNQTLRVQAMIRDCVFTCNTRYMFDAYKSNNPTWMMQYSAGASLDLATHATDLIPTFMNGGSDITDFVNECLGITGGLGKDLVALIEVTYNPYQAWFASLARTWNPNTEGHPLTSYKWETAIPDPTGHFISNVMNVTGNLFSGLWETIDVTVNSAGVCYFWTATAQLLEEAAPSTCETQRQGPLYSEEL